MSWVVTCSQCGKSAVYERGQEVPDLCPQCSEKKRKGKKVALGEQRKRAEMLAVGVSRVPGRRVTKSLGIVNHEVVLGLKLPQGSRPDRFNEAVAPKWAEGIRRAREASIRFILNEALSRGGNGVVGISLTYEVLASNRSTVVLLVAVSGTAVVVR